MKRRSWSQADVIEVLREAGLPLARSAEVDRPEQLGDVLPGLGDGPYVLKAGGLLHKSDDHGVVLDLADLDAAEAAAAALLSRIGPRALPLLVQEQASGLEVLVGARRDPELGPMVVIGRGGVETELYRDIVYAVAPLNAEQAEDALRDLAMWPLLSGFRGATPADVQALVDVVVTVSELVAHDRSIGELDLNPVLVGSAGHGTRIVDARIIGAEAAPTIRPVPSAGLGRLMRPEHVAVVGVSDDPRKVGARLYRYLAEHGFAGRLDPVHPLGGSLGDRVRYPSLGEVPGSPDLVCIAVPALAVMGVVQEAIAKGVGGIIVHSSDFAEVGEQGRALQREVAATAAAAGIPLIGPNSMGILDPHRHLAASISGGMEDESVKPGNMALLTSSGALGSCLATRLTGAGFGLSRWVHVGNESDRVLADVLDWLAGDEGTGVIGLLLEGIKDGPAFVRAGKANVAAGRPLFAYSMARSDRGRAAARSHTGAMVGNFEHREAVLRAAGVVSVPSLRVLEDAMVLAATTPEPRGDRLMAVTMSGGACSIIADEADVGRILLPELSEPTRETVAHLVADFAAVRNPLDCSFQILSTPENLGALLDGLLARDEFDALLLQLTTNADPTAAELAQAVVAARDRAQVPVYVSRYGGAQLAPRALEVYAAAGVPVLDAPDRAVHAIAAVMDAARQRRQLGLPARDEAVPLAPDHPPADR